MTLLVKTVVVGFSEPSKVKLHFSCVWTPVPPAHLPLPLYGIVSNAGCSGAGACGHDERRRCRCHCYEADGRSLGVQHDASSGDNALFSSVMS